ncbi:alternate-type signal peptide domain-containing protein [Microbacterium sp. NPDC096154]|uniref:alternate-type signal peptide domain-containing protein n=1 Tax=Microbacterium sp. NPDC096154 TaxID=3155549 RepID=UPI003333692B
MENNSPTIVVTEERRSRKGPLLLGAGLAGVALLAGGGTFALWSANDAFQGGTITAGDLNLVQVADTTFWDVSADRADATATVTGTDGSQLGHAIASIADWRIVPGDKVAASFSADVTLEGDNLVGKLSIAGLDGNTYGNGSMTYTYEIYQDGALLIPETALPTAATADLLYLAAPVTGQDAGLDDAEDTTPVYAMANTTEDFTVVVYGAFDATAGDAGKVDADGDGVYDDQTTAATGTRQDALTADVLNGIVLQLDQVRDTGAQF